MNLWYFTETNRNSQNYLNRKGVFCVSIICEAALHRVLRINCVIFPDLPENKREQRIALANVRTGRSKNHDKCCFCRQLYGFICRC